MEQFVAPPGLDGSNGKFRLPCEYKSIKANTDIEAVRAWIASLTEISGTTVTGYRSSVEKILNWACFARGKALSSLDNSDLQAFVDFLAAPYPALDWICRSYASRDSPDWRPFSGPLSKGSVQVVMSAVSSLFSWLDEVGYASMPLIAANQHRRDGFSTLRLTTNTSVACASRTLSSKAWLWIKEVITGGIDFRTRFVIELMYFGNLRVEEIRRLRIADCIAPSSDCVAWRLQVDSMTNRLGCVYVLPPICNSLTHLFELCSESPSASLQAPEIRRTSKLLLAPCQWIPYSVKCILRRSADLARSNGDKQTEEELRNSTLIRFRGALEEHVGHDPAFILGFVANAKGSRDITAKYLQRKSLDNNAIRSGWMRIAEHWQPYSERLSLDAASVPVALGRTLNY